MSCVPVSVAASRTPRRKSSVGQWMPETPWMPSTITAANSRVASFVRSAPRSFSGVNSTFGVRLNGAEIAGLSVAATAPDVRPWNALPMASTFARPVWNEASFRAFSLASAPELQRKRR